MVESTPNPIKELVKNIKVVGKPLLKNLSVGHQRGLKTVRGVLGLFVCQQCGYHQPEPFGVCPKCGRPRSGLYVPRKK